MNTSFYNNTMNDSNTINTETLLDNLKQQHSSFNLTELSSDIREINYKTIIDSLDNSKVTAKWELPETKAKGKGTGIQSFKLKSGDVLGIGSKVSSNCLLI